VKLTNKEKKIFSTPKDESEIVFPELKDGV